MNIDSWINFFTAVGTCGAVIVSLWLARRDSKPKLKCIVSGTRVEFNDGEYFWPDCRKIVNGHRQMYVKKITNIGRIPVYVEAFRIKAHKQNRYLFGTNSSEKIELLPGKSFEFKFQMVGMVNQLNNLDYFNPNKHVVFVIHDSCGNEHKFKDAKVMNFGGQMTSEELVEKTPKLYI